MAFKVKLPPIFLGGAYKKKFRWYTEDEAGVRTPVDLTGKNGMIQLRTEAGHPTVLAEWSTANGKLEFSDTNLITIKVGRAETEGYNFETVYWDLIIWPGVLVDEGEVIMYGTVEGRRTITDIA